ncbi:hypothetical protein OG948_03380 [Embleya sp. NBC_00888]|uniref:hypothetical protein n=1 Tax=Embleya sp. NBC_00888 TaxID=2975960 RepID=UPI00386EA315|nr:hypothetical protein OG948_03380 [Embleya sp. NBC_00888]
MPYIRLDRVQKGVFVGAVEKLDIDDLPPFRQGRHQAMDPVYHLSRVPVHEDGWQRFVDFRESGYVFLILTFRAR